MRRLLSDPSTHPPPAQRRCLGPQPRALPSDPPARQHLQQTTGRGEAADAGDGAREEEARTDSTAHNWHVRKGACFSQEARHQAGKAAREEAHRETTHAEARPEAGSEADCEASVAGEEGCDARAALHVHGADAQLVQGEAPVDAADVIRRRPRGQRAGVGRQVHLGSLGERHAQPRFSQGSVSYISRTHCSVGPAPQADLLAEILRQRGGVTEL